MMTDKQEKIKARRIVVKQTHAINKQKGGAITPLVNSLAKRFKVSTVTIYGDMAALGLTTGKKNPNQLTNGN